MRFFVFLISFLGLVFLSGGAKSHPHIWIDMTMAISLNETLEIDKISSHWVFDEGYTSFVFAEDLRQGDTPGESSLRELANIVGPEIEMFDFFIRFDQNSIPFSYQDPFVMSFDGQRINASFGIVPNEPISILDFDEIHIGDESYFVYFEFSGKDDSRLTLLGDGAENCSFTLTHPKEDVLEELMLIPESAFVEADNYDFDYDAYFRSTIVIHCS